MSEESITDIIADLRNDNIPRLSGEDMIRCLLHNTADRLDAAVKRIKKILADARCDIAVLDQLEYATTGEVAAPGNAAAMRAALERIVNLAPEYPADGVDWNALAAEAFLTASSALAAPARNCDRPECATAEGAIAALRANPCADHDFCKEQIDCAECATRWLIAPAEGGDHA